MTVFWDQGVRRPSTGALNADKQADLCVVGLGGSGLTAIRAAQVRGMSVIGIDAGRLAAGAAGRNGGFALAGIAKFHHVAVADHGRNTAAAMYRATLAEMDRLAIDLPGAFRRCGVVRIAADDAEFEDCMVHQDALLADGFAVSPYAGPQGRGILIPTDGVFHPVRRAALLAQQAISAGAALYTQTPALTIESGLVHTPAGTIAAANILVAVDGGLARLLPQLDGRVRDVRLQMVATAPSVTHLEYPVYARDGYDYWQQHADGSVTIGGGRDVAGESEWTSSSEPTDIVSEYLRSVLDGIGVTEPITHAWAATVGYTLDGRPIVSEVMPGVWAVGGYCGTGNIVGALLARGVIELLDTGASADVAAFAAPALAD